MKKLFNKLAVKNPSLPPSPGLQPKDVVPPVPHPCPHDHIALLVTKDGLLLRPQLSGLAVSQKYARIGWGKDVKVEDSEGDVSDGHNWHEESAIVYGIVGVLELFSAAYLLVITARFDVGHLFHTTHTIYGVKGVTAIPLVEHRAQMAINTLISRNTALTRPSLLPSDTLDTVSFSHDAGVDPPTESGSTMPNPNGTPRVKFSNEDQVKIMTPIKNSFDSGGDVNDAPPSPTISVNSSSGGSEFSNQAFPVAKTVANRLSFWSRLSKRASTSVTPTPNSVAEEQQALNAIIMEGEEEPGAVLEEILANTAPPPVLEKERHSELEDKIVRECIREYTKGGMYFAYNFDITRSLQRKQEQVAKSKRQDALLADLNVLDEKYRLSVVGDKVHVLAEPFPTLPLWRRVDRQYWWNEWLSKPFIDAGLHSYVLPIMQGYYQISSFNVPREPIGQEVGDHAVVDYVVISRRSKERAGLRYQRRGVDDDAHVANFVETETVMRVDREGYSNVFSYVQLRGSIPLFWTQSGTGLKPAPQLSPDRTHHQNLSALRKHFERTIPRYGPHTIVNLAEQQGKEAAITRSYRECTQELNLKDVQYREYDFHIETKGMKYENISKLIDVMERTFEQQSWLWMSDDAVMSEQKGVFRVNCIDCLDRTNVVQSAFARHMLNRQLGVVALLNPTEEGKTAADIVVNDVWANNGDAISRAYAGTSALKGDFTRTGKRDLGGLLNDGVNSLARMYTSTFSDWFCQAVIDFMLGYRTLSVFSEFLLKLQSTDPRDLIRLSKIRAEAIATSVERVLSEGERLLSGWTLFAPEEMNAKIGEKFEEKVLLLTVQALYIVRYDYTLEKVKMYTRVPLGDIVGISKGAYIISPLEEGSRDPEQNSGFVVTWLNSRQTTRLTTYSVRNSLDRPTSPPPSSSSTHSRSATAPIQAPSSKSTPHHRSTTSRPSSPGVTSSGFSLSRPTFALQKGTVLSKILSQAATSMTSSGDITFAAFKALPIDPARIRRASSSGFVEPATDLTGATACKEAVDVIVDAVGRACRDIGNTREDFISNVDVVSLAEAQRMTSMYAKMEYGVKRLLWLGG